MFFGGDSPASGGKSAESCCGLGKARLEWRAGSLSPGAKVDSRSLTLDIMTRRCWEMFKFVGYLSLYSLLLFISSCKPNEHSSKYGHVKSRNRSAPKGFSYLDPAKDKREYQDRNERAEAILNLFAEKLKLGMTAEAFLGATKDAKWIENGKVKIVKNLGFYGDYGFRPGWTLFRIGLFPDCDGWSPWCIEFMISGNPSKKDFVRFLKGKDSDKNTVLKDIVLKYASSGKIIRIRDEKNYKPLRPF